MARKGQPRAPEAAADGAVLAAQQLRLQMLTAEHASLSATRSLVWNETFSRASMFLTSLSGGIVALALAGQGTGFTGPFIAFALVVLAVVLFLGITTFIRLGASNYHDAQCVIGMNRIRAAYLEIAPDLERYFVMSAHDDPRGVEITMGFPPNLAQVPHVLAATAGVVWVVNSVIFGAIVGLATVALSRPVGYGLAAAVAAFLVSAVGHALYGGLAVRRGRRRVDIRFPSPPDS
jgi:hypothetical protein